MGYLYLAIAVAAEIMGTSCLKMTNGFTKPGPAAASILGFVTCAFMLAKSLEHLPLSLVYATWCAVGIVAATVISIFVFREYLSVLGGVGIALMVVGVVMLNVYGPGH